MHTYYFKGKAFLTVQLSQNVSWIIKSILKQREIMQSMTDWNLMQIKFESIRVYEHIKEKFLKVD